MKLKEKKCEPCSGNEKPLEGDDVKEMLGRLTNDWESINDKKIRKSFSFEKYKQGVDFADKVAEIAEDEGHHPDICIHYKKIVIEITTHAINGY